MPKRMMPPVMRNASVVMPKTRKMNVPSSPNPVSTTNAVTSARRSTAARCAGSYDAVLAT